MSGTVIVLDHQAKRFTLDGREVAPADCIGADFDIDTNEGFLGAVTLTLFADNIVIRTESGRESRPVASDAARRIVREGMADILEWIGEKP